MNANGILELDGLSEILASHYCIKKEKNKLLLWF